MENEERLVNLAFVLRAVPANFIHEVEQLISVKGYNLVYVKKAPISVILKVVEVFPEKNEKEEKKEGKNNGTSFNFSDR